MELPEKIRKVREEQAPFLKKRLSEFKAVKNSQRNRIFSELCYCLLTANFNAKRTISIQKEIGDGFLTLPEKELAKKLKELGHRFPNTRAKYIVEARKYKDSLRFDREWLVKNIRGLGMKEASHFLRNIGFTDYAIIDFHIIDLLVREGIIKRPNTLTRRKYIEIEDRLRKINENLAELDLILWFIETGTILK